MKKKEYKKHNLKTMSKEIQEVQNRLQDVHDYNETRGQMGGIQRNTLQKLELHHTIQWQEKRGSSH